MRRLFPLIVLLLVYAFTPGMCELVEISVHFVATGDLHASDAERHSEHGDAPEKGGECHTCFCHAPTVFPVVAALSPQLRLPPEQPRPVFAVVSSMDDGITRELYRPPIS